MDGSTMALGRAAEQVRRARGGSIGAGSQQRRDWMKTVFMDEMSRGLIWVVGMDGVFGELVIVLELRLFGDELAAALGLVCAAAERKKGVVRC
ncbi:hypothetical protein M0R45_016108 [Rubus argutus]|uniref:Uncharacterized protein n=1 Tax=Rubus argutus TaxID=59490 RepID=A0AAW1XS56_RUBAR